MDKLSKLGKIFNFNHKSYGAWATLLFSIVAAAVAILKVFGIEVSSEQTKDVTLVITAILNVFVALGIITAPTDKPKGDNK